MTRYIYILLVFGLLFICGCSTTTKCNIASNGNVPEGYSLIFGKLLDKSSEPNILHSIYYDVLNRKNGSYAVKYEKDAAEEYFYWCLPPGQYVIANYVDIHGFMGGSSSANKKRINGIFDVNANDKLVYIGLIDIDSKIVFDDSDRALVELKYKYHGLNNIHQKRLIIFEKER